MRQHTAWLVATIQEIPALATKTFVTVAKYPAPSADVKVLPPYVVIHPTAGADKSDRLDGPAVTQSPRFVVHAVGLNADQAAWAAEAIKDQLLINGRGVIPEIPGERPGQVWYTSPLPIQLDTDVSPALCYHVAECGFSSDPA
ncbi:hypothetical protein [Cryobacterium cryoconiti]|uniref:DUF3168 domain-containing protein n=1 Tax=Cryobacterium cryoconiti TaxID=1259239 RepID=A0A4Y8JUC6_9MICO|nr:hypothetical protein [Cryobacterium cryoconiti]TFD27521.1 hypothetical protein E3T49_13345 [Cryobacterium cryoconiti]